MKYRVTRSSDYRGIERPCTKAYQDGSKDMWNNLLWWVDITSIDDLKALMEENGGRGRWLDYNEAMAFGLADEVCEISKDEVIDNVVMPIVDHSYLVIAIIIALYIVNLLFDATDFAELLLVTGILCIAIAQILTLKKLLKDKQD